MLYRLALLLLLMLLLVNCYGQVAVGDDIEQTMHVEKKIVSQDTVGIVVFGLVGALCLAAVIAGFAASGGGGPYQQ